MLIRPAALTLLGLVSSGGIVGAEEERLPLPFFFRELKEREPTTLSQRLPADLFWLAGYTHYRNIPGKFPEQLDYHFDGE